MMNNLPQKRLRILLSEILLSSFTGTSSAEAHFMLNLRDSAPFSAKNLMLCIFVLAYPLFFGWRGEK